MVLGAEQVVGDRHPLGCGVDAMVAERHLHVSAHSQNVSREGSPVNGGPSYREAVSEAWTITLYPLAVVGALSLLLWLGGVGWILRRRPPPEVRRELLPLLPDITRLLRRLSEDRGLAVALRKRARRAYTYLIVPMDLVPDFLPAIGQIDDLVVAIDALVAIVGEASVEAIERAWPGDELGLAALRAGIGLSRGWETRADHDQMGNGAPGPREA